MNGAVGKRWLGFGRGKTPQDKWTKDGNLWGSSCAGSSVPPCEIQRKTAG